MNERMKTSFLRFLAYFWVYLPLAAALGCAAVGGYVVIRYAAPPGAQLLLEVATLMGLLLGLSAWGSSVAGAKLLADDTPTEPVKLREAGWMLGVPPGLLAGVLVVLYRRLPPEMSFLQAYAVPLVLAVMVGTLLWATAGRALARAAGLSLDDYACGLLLPRERYLVLREHKRAVRQQAAGKE